MSAASIHLSETRSISASPDTLYGLISDIAAIPWDLAEITVANRVLADAVRPDRSVRSSCRR